MDSKERHVYTHVLLGAAGPKVCIYVHVLAIKCGPIRRIGLCLEKAMASQSQNYRSVTRKEVRLIAEPCFVVGGAGMGSRGSCLIERIIQASTGFWVTGRPLLYLIVTSNTKFIWK